MENSSISNLENSKADEAVLEALLEDAKKPPGEAGLRALLAQTDKGGEAALEELLEKTLDGRSKKDDQIAREKALLEKQERQKIQERQKRKQRKNRSEDSSGAGASGAREARASRNATSIKTEMLIVHADSTQRSVLEMSFISEGYKVVNFETGKEALNYLKTNVPDIMLLDAEMEKLTGMDICYRIRKIQRFETVPVIILTESNDDKTETMVKMCHANDYFPKTSKNIELKAKVRKLLENSDVQKLTRVDVE